MRQSWLYKMDGSGETPLSRAEKSGYRVLAEMLLRLEREEIFPERERADTLHEAAYWGLSAAAKRLLEEGADPSETDIHGDTPLLQAVRNGHEETVSLLIESGADLNEANEWGMTALHWVALNGRQDLAEALLNQGAEVNPRAMNVGGLTPRAIALLMNYGALVSYMGSRGGKC